MADIVLAAAIGYAAVVGGLIMWLHIRHTRLEEANARLELQSKKDAADIQAIKTLKDTK